MWFMQFMNYITQSNASRFFSTKSQNFWLNWKHEETRGYPAERLASRNLIIFLLFTGAGALWWQGNKTSKCSRAPVRVEIPLLGLFKPPKMCRRKRNAANINMRAKIDRFLSFWQSIKAPINLSRKISLLQQWPIICCLCLNWRLYFKTKKYW